MVYFLFQSEGEQQGGPKKKVAARGPLPRRDVLVLILISVKDEAGDDHPDADCDAGDAEATLVGDAAGDRVAERDL